MAKGVLPWGVGMGGGGGTVARDPINFPAGSIELTKLVELDVTTVAALIIMHSSASSAIWTISIFQYFRKVGFTFPWLLLFDYL